MKLYKPTKPLSRGHMAALLAMLITIMPFSIDAYLPALLDISTALNADIHHIEQSLSSFMLGIAIGQITGGSLSDIKGRRNIALVGLCIYLIGSFGLIFVQTSDQLLTLRIVQALGAGMSAVVVGAVVRDNYQGREAAQMFALIGIIVMAAPLIAPLFGSFLRGLAGWRSIFAFLFIYATFVTILLFRFLPQRKAAEPITREQVRQIGSRYYAVLSNKAALGFLFYQAASFASMLVFLSESPFVYMKLYGLSPTQYAWVFGCNIVMMMSCNRLTAFGLKRNWESHHLLLVGIIIQFTANLLLFSSVMIAKQPALWWFVPCVVCSVGAQGLIAANSQALFMGNFKPEMGGSANAVLSSSQSLIGAGAGFVVTLLHNGTANVMAGGMFVSTVVGVILLWTLSGKQLRQAKL
ncbi:multidrug effflux MFS transporter [Kingella kingae]|uniref:multidrug effflux MFS transporter n=1 Tax=Kingella kingae TaxID=504 RepID=UPI0003F63B31|nr:multidrug effflux MFS transporter [Kingella kingae]MDK4625067.1 multidrug effflux MFS transporter [Kingella kingae]MDK4660739.1 multidrug effflux MFS transporter [Kingella kingae]MDK4668707.1 multidrug effflux MFS transporter [Kingella kingae]MDK4687108.1 multidrug effflux MFS transporter [Kingella kingae]